MRIYISSTFTDLREYRAAAALSLRSMGHDVIGMEEYVAESMTPLERSIGDAATVAAYVVIVAWHYGYRPQDARNPRGLSITELEYEAARDAGVPILAFLLHPDAPWPPSAIDALSETGGAEIQRFRTLLGQNHLAGLFTSPDGLASKVAVAVAVQGLNRRMIDLALTKTSLAAQDSMRAFGGGGDLTSSIGAIRTMVARAGPARMMEVRIGRTHLWWHSRLYLLAVLTGAVTAVRQFVFSDDGGRYIGMASPAAVREGLAATFPKLQEFDADLTDGASRDIDREIQRATKLWTERMQPAEEAEKVEVRPALLTEWLGERLVTRSVEVGPKLTMADVREIVFSLIPDVPIERHVAPKRDPKKDEEGKPGTSEPGGPPPGPAAEPPPGPAAEPPPGPAAEPAPGPAVEPGRAKAEPPPELMVVDRDAFALELARASVRSGLPQNMTP